MIPILMLHGIGCTGAVFDRLRTEFLQHGFYATTPTLFPDLRVKEAPSPALAELTLADYVAAAEAEAAKISAETGLAPVLLGHSMGALLVQKLATRGVGAAGVLVTPAQPTDCRVFHPAVLYTFWNVIRAGDETQSYKIWRKGFDWGVLNQVPKDQRDAIYAEAVFDSGRVYRDIGQPDKDPARIAEIDARDVKIPLLTVGARKDRATVIAAVRKVGAKYAAVGGAYVEYPNNAHWIIDEPGTDRVVADVAQWLHAQLRGR